MKKNSKQIELNEETLDITEKKEKKDAHSAARANSDSKKSTSKKDSLLSYMSVFERSPLFKEKTINKGELLFDEGTIDNNLYIIKEGLLSVEKYTTIQRIDTKQLAILEAGDFLGEASLDKIDSKKEALVRALKTSKILAIDAKNDLKRFVEENSHIGYELLRYIIVETNRRLLESNRIVTVNYEIERQIRNLKAVGRKSIFELIDKIKGIVGVDYVIYIEKHQVVDNFFTLKYDSRKPNKMQDIVFERKGYFLDLDELYEKAGINSQDQVVVNKLSIGNEVYGYLMFGKEKEPFSGSDKKVFVSIANSFVGVLKKFFVDRDDASKLYIGGMEKV